MSNILSEKFIMLLESVKLQDIKPVSIYSELLGEMPAPNNEIKLSWTQAYADDDPHIVKSEVCVFRPKYEFTVSFENVPFFRHVSVFIIAFRIKELTAFEDAWKDNEVRKVFKENQLQKTMWPFLRQQVHDGMSRLGIKPLPLPWIL